MRDPYAEQSIEYRHCILEHLILIALIYLKRLYYYGTKPNKGVNASGEGQEEKKKLHSSDTYIDHPRFKEGK